MCGLRGGDLHDIIFVSSEDVRDNFCSIVLVDVGEGARRTTLMASESLLERLRTSVILGVVADGNHADTATEIGVGCSFAATNRAARPCRMPIVFSARVKSMSYSVAVAGASGYAGGEVLRLAAQHPELEVRTVTAHTNAGQPLIDVHPHLRSLAHLDFVETTPKRLAGHDIVILALPHGASGAIATELSPETLVLDCGADHRLTSDTDWARFYGGDYHAAWSYGLPELVHADGSRQRQQLVGARRIAVPGCNATAVSLALAPGIQSGVIAGRDVTAMLAVGPSGAGRTLRADLLASELLGSAQPYGVGGVHRHIPEVLQNMRLAGATDPTLSFTPVLVPMARGILATVTARLAPGADAALVRHAWQAAYAAEPFVHVLPEGRFPATASTAGANTALIGLAVDDDAQRAVIVVALDNLVKGTAGAALQSLNVALGLPETLGLPVNGVAP